MSSALRIGAILLAGGLLGLLYGITWAAPALPEPGRIFVAAGIDGVLWLGLLTLPRDEPGDADATQASVG